MVFKDEVCMWFKDNESHRRLELLCGLLNMCLPFELRFIRTCVDDLGKRDGMLQEFDSKANSSQEISQFEKVLDERTRSKFIVYIALLEASNQTCSKLLYEKLISFPDLPNTALNDDDKSNLNHIKEMLLIYTMVLHHPAFTFEEKRVIGERLQSLQLHEDGIYEKSWNMKNESQFTMKTCSQEDLTLEPCNRVSSPQIGLYEACDSGLSIGTEPEIELISDHVCASVVIPSGKDASIPSIDNTLFEGFKESGEEHPASNQNPSLLRCSRKPTYIANPTRSKNSTSDSLLPDNDLGVCGHPCQCVTNRDASSSGSGESGDLYGDSATVPTTYIYNSNIYEHQNISELPVGINSNLLNLKPGYMCHHNGNCHFYQYSALGNTLAPVSVPRKTLPHGTPSDTSSSEEGGSTVVTSKQQRVSLNSPSSSPQSSPYASPPQSLSPSRAASPPENNLGPTYQLSKMSCLNSHGIVTGTTTTTTTVVSSRSSPRPSSRHSSSGIGSHSSSPALASNTQTYRSKQAMTSKASRYAVDRCSGHIGTLPHTQDSMAASQVPVTATLLTKANAIVSCAGVSSDTQNVYKSVCSVESSYSNGPAQNICENGSSTINTSPNNVTLTTTNALKSSTIVTPAVISNNCFQKGNSRGLKTVSPKKSEFLKSSEAVIEETKNQDEMVVQVYDCKSYRSLKVKCVTGEKSHVNLPNGFIEPLIPSSAHSLPHPHSTPVTTTVPSCSCSHIPNFPSHQNESLKSSNQDFQIYDQATSGNVPSSAESKLGCDAPRVISTSKSDKCNTVDSTVTSNIKATNVSEIPSIVNNTTSAALHMTNSNTPRNSVTTTSVKNFNQTSGKTSFYHKEDQPVLSGVSQSVSAGSRSVSNGSASVYTTTTTNTSASVVPIVAPHGSYPSFFNLSMLPGGNSSYLPQSGFPHHGSVRAPSPAFFVASHANMVHGPPSHYMKGAGNPHMLPPPSLIGGTNFKSKNNVNGRSGSSSSSCSSGAGRKKALNRGVPFQNKSRSSDSSPSSSQYSSPPQTPSPDHTKDARSKAGKPNDVYRQDEVWDQVDSKGSSVPGGGGGEEGPPLPPISSHVLMPSNPVHQRYMPYHHHQPLGIIGYPTHRGIFRYPLTSPSIVMGPPRPPTPLSNEKPSRETTPPHPHMGVVDLSQKPVEYSSAGATVPSPVSLISSTQVSSQSAGPSSTTPSIVPAPIPDAANVALGSAVHTGPQNGSMQYNPPNYPLFAGQFVTHLSGFLPSHGSALPNGYVSPHGLPPNYPPVPTMTNGMGSDLIYPGQYPVIGQTNSTISSCGGHSLMHPSSAATMPVFSSPYQNVPPSSTPIPPPVKKPQSCYNCGRVGHRGSDCKESSIDDLTKRTKLL